MSSFDILEGLAQVKFGDAPDLEFQKCFSVGFADGAVGDDFA